MNIWEKFYKAFIINKGYIEVLNGLTVTLKIAFFGFLIGLVIGTFISIIKIGAKNSKIAYWFSKLGDFYVALFRGTPIIVQLLVVYYILFPTIGIQVDKLVVAIVTFGLNSGAYVSEIMRAGINSVDIGQTEGGRAIGLGFWTTMFRIIIPQAFKNILPTLGNELIALVKDTSVVGFIAVVDLTRAFQLLGSGTYEYIAPYLVLAATYLVIVLILTGIIKLFEKLMSKNDAKKAHE